MARGSALDAAGRALRETRARLRPFHFGRWLTLGFVAWLDQCGRSGAGFQWPGGPGGGGSGGEGHGGLPPANDILAWIAGHALLLAGIAAAIVAVILVVAAFVSWLQSRGTFVYLD